MMKIVHLLSQIELTGAEAYAVTLANWQRANGSAVTIISNNLHIATSVPFVTRTIHTRRFLTRWSNILFLRKFLKENEINILHCHSRAAIRVGFWATRGLKVALISSVHGRQHPSFSKKLFDLYGDRVIGVCQNVVTSLHKDFGMKQRKMLVIGNPVSRSVKPSEPPPVKKSTSLASLQLAVIGRSSGPKGMRTREFLRTCAPLLLKNHPNLHIDVIGGFQSELDSHSSSLALLVRTIEDSFPGRLGFRGHLKNLRTHLPEYDLVLGSGRIAIECLFAEIPVFALGEYASLGLVTIANYEALRDSNFGDMGVEELSLPFDFLSIAKEVASVLRDLPAHRLHLSNLKEKAEIDFDAESVCRAVQEVYESTAFRKWHPRHIPVLMYHKIPLVEAPSKHRIFVTKDNFERHLRYFQRRRMTTLSFKELAEYRNFTRSPRNFPKNPLILTFDDGYVDNLKNAAPLLRKYGMKATIFLLADPEVHSNYWDDESGDPSEQLMSPAQKKELTREAFEIGSHGFKHEKITSMNAAQAFHELSQSKAELEKQLGIRINVFAFTYGITAPWAAKLARKAGYTFAVNTDTGGLHLEDDPYAIFRTPVFPEDKEPQLRKKTASWYRRYFYLKRGK